MNQIPSSSSSNVDLTNCDREPIHIPGTIQPHGILLAFDRQMTKLLRHSTNAAIALGREGDLNGMSAEDLLGECAVHDLRNALSTMRDDDTILHAFASDGNDTPFDVSLHRHCGHVIVELETPPPVPVQPLRLLQLMNSRVAGQPTVDGLLKQAAQLVRGVLEYDRVMIYRFAADGSGKVVQEQKNPDLESFLGQHFPASDIPAQARVLYMKNTIRVISDASNPTVPIEPVLDESGAALDLSCAHLRSVSAIHCEYLRNMGVAAAMSISIIVDGVLWGLIACHHYSPRVLSMGKRVAAEMFGEFLSLHLAAILRRNDVDRAMRVRARIEQMTTLSSSDDIAQVLADRLLDYDEFLIPCDGAVLLFGDRTFAFGATPDPSDIAMLLDQIAPLGRQIWATHCLSQHLPTDPFRQTASGAMVIPISQTPRDYIVLFRRELIQTLDWAGNPEKSYPTGPFGDRLTPRKSFAIWKEQVLGQSAPWTDEEREIGSTLRIAITDVLLRHHELVSEERDKADVRLRMLNDELNHRVKNILAVIGSIVRQPASEQLSLAEYVSRLQGRIQALATAHDQIIRGSGGGYLNQLLEAEIAPHTTERRQVTLQGPPLWLDPRAFSVLALVLHELVTNAVKYGSLSRTVGRLEVVWSKTDAGEAKIEWRETGGPDVSPPERHGFGTTLLDRAIPFDLNGTSVVDFLPGGLNAEFTIPGRYLHFADVQAEAVAAPGIAAPGISAPPHIIPPITQVLLVEDQILIAMDAEAFLHGMGLKNVKVAGSVEIALKAIAQHPFQLGVLDLNLGAETSIPVATALLAQGATVVFTTGYGAGSAIPDSLCHLPVLQKPYTETLLRAAVEGAWAARSGVSSR